MDISEIMIHVNYGNCKCCCHAMASSLANSEKYYSNSENGVYAIMIPWQRQMSTPKNITPI
jgi:hypothetical protein